MWNSAIVAASDEAAGDRWWDMSSFWPDMLVGAATALVIGLSLSGYEWWRAGRSRQAALSEQQSRAAEVAAQLLSPSFIYAGAGADALLPAGTRLQTVRTLVDGVPAGRGARLVPGFTVLSELSRTYAVTETIVENIRTRVDEYQRGESPRRVADRLYERINDLARREDLYLTGWWDTGSRPPADLAPLDSKLETDFNFMEDVSHYLYNRRLLDRGREGFLIAWTGTGSRSHEATMKWLSTMVDGKHHWPNNWVEEVRLRRAQARAAIAAEIEGDEYVSEVRGGC